MRMKKILHRYLHKKSVGEDSWSASDLLEQRKIHLNEDVVLIHSSGESIKIQDAYLYNNNMKEV